MTKITPRKKPFNVLIGVTGSVAAIKLIELIRKLRSNFPRSFKNKGNNQTYKANIAIKVVMTQSSMHFIPKEDLTNEANQLHIEEVLCDADEWSRWNKIGDPVLHIELRKWADLLLIAPLDANTMAKLANGICDNLLTCTVRAWDTSKPLIYCPAMNVNMYEHPITRQQLTTLQSFGYYRVDCIAKRLACGDFGLGAMAAIETIADKVLDCLTNQNPRPHVPQKIETETTPSGTVDPSLSASLLEQIKLATETKSIKINNISSMNQRPKTFSNANNPFMVSENSESFYQHHLPPEDKYLDDFPEETSNNGLKDRVSSDRVTSLQNLKAINLAHHNGLDTDHDEAPGVAGALIQANVNNKLPISKKFKTFNLTNERLKLALPNGSPNSLSKKSSTLDPAAFITYCYNEDRDCFTCIICKNDYKNRKSMSRHLKEQHLQGNIHRCSPCGVSYKRREKLIKHNREHHCLVGPS